MVVLKYLTHVFIILLMSVFITACESSSKKFVVKEPSADKGSVVYLYRPRDVANVMLTPEIIVDGLAVQSLANGEYRQLYLSPGVHVINLLAVEGYTAEKQLSVKVKPESVHYLRLMSSLDMKTGARYSAFKREFGVREVSAVVALNELDDCRDADAKAVQKITTSNTEDQADKTTGGIRFSIEKMSDPFSH